MERGKPDPEPYRLGAALVGVPPGECLVVEDAPSGIRAGLDAGCQVLGVVGTHRAEELHEAGAVHLVQSLADVHATIEEGRISVHFMRG